MKTYLFLAALLAPSFVACSQNSTAENLPSVVQNALKTRYADAASVEWKKVEGHYEAEFKLGATGYEALIDASGNILMVKEEIASASLPDIIRQTIGQEFTGYKLDDAEKIVRNGNTYYQVELERWLSEKKAVYAADGTKATDFPYWD